MFFGSKETTYKENSTFIGGNPPILHLQDINVILGNSLILKNINLNITRGEIVFITGPSGAGKTTLLRLMAGEFDHFKGRMHHNFTKDEFMGRIFQDLRLIEHLSIEQNLQFSYDPQIFKNKREFQRELLEITKFLGIDRHLDLKMSKANGGLKQLVAFTRTLLSRPSVVLADEPTCSLDFDNAKKVFDILNLYNVKRGLTVVWASHNRELVSKFSGRIIHLDKGKLVYTGHACFI